MINVLWNNPRPRILRKWLLPAGVLLVALGLTAYIAPSVALTGFLCMTGLGVAAAGLQALVRRIRRKEGLSRIAFAALWAVSGLLMIMYPFTSLTLLNGVISVMLIGRALLYAVRWWRETGKAQQGGGYPLWRSVLLLILALVMLNKPLLLSAVLAYIIGFPLLLLGALLIAAALFLRRLPRNIRDIRSSFEEPDRDAEYEIVEEHIHRPAGGQ